MAESFTYSYVVALRTLLYTRFASILGLAELRDDSADAVNKGVIYCPKRIAQRTISEKRGETFLEFINFYQSSFRFSWNRQRTVLARRGIPVLKANGGYTRVKANPVDLSYDIWFWSNSLDKVYLCLESYVRWQHDTPKIVLTYNDEYALNPDLTFGAPVDESSINDVFNLGKIWCFSLPLNIEGWLPDEDSVFGQIEKIQVTTYDKDSVTSISTVYVEDSNQDTELEAALRMFKAKLYSIKAVSVANKTFTTPNDRRTDFTAGVLFTVENSTENNGIYTVASSVYSREDEETTIVVVEEIPGLTVDGNIYKHEGTS